MYEIHINWQASVTKHEVKGGDSICIIVLFICFERSTVKHVTDENVTN